MHNIWENLKNNLDRLVTPIILAGGEGTRLRSVIGEYPKCLIKIKGKEFVKYLLDQLNLEGFKKTILCVGFMRDVIINNLGEQYNDVKLIYSIEERPLGTGGAVINALRLVDTPYILVLNGDSIADISMKQFIIFSMLNHAQFTIATTYVTNVSRYGQLLFNEKTQMVAMKEKSEVVNSNWINAGIYLIEAELLRIYPYYNEMVSLEKEIIPYYLNNKIYVFPTRSSFVDIGIPEDMTKAEDIINLVDNKDVLVIVDRDGTMIEDKVYLNDPQKIEFIENTIEGIKLLNDNQIKLVIGTNQSGVGRGIIKENELITINNKIMYHLAEKGAAVDGIYYCPHKPDDYCKCRKPDIGMYQMMIQDFPRIKYLYVIGDTLYDVEFAKNIGARMYLIKRGNEVSDNQNINENIIFVSDIYEAACDIVNRHRK